MIKKYELLKADRNSVFIIIFVKFINFVNMLKSKCNLLFIISTTSIYLTYSSHHAEVNQDQVNQFSI